VESVELAERLPLAVASAVRETEGEEEGVLDSVAPRDCEASGEAESEDKGEAEALCVVEVLTLCEGLGESVMLAHAVGPPEMLASGEEVERPEGVPLALIELLREDSRESVGWEESEGQGDAEGEGEVLREDSPEPEAEGEGESVGRGLLLVQAVGDGVLLGEGEGEALGEACEETDAEGEGEARGVGEAQPVGVPMKDSVDKMEAVERSDCVAATESVAAGEGVESSPVAEARLD
jgi:hypothetical protein